MTHRGCFLLALALLEAIAFPARAEPVRSLLEMRHDRVVIQEWDNSCGAAALATVLTYGFQDAVSERAVAQGMLRRTDPLRVKVRGGFSLLDMKRFAESRGYQAAGFRSLTLEELLALRDPIVPIDLHDDPHFVVVRGLRDGKLELADPAFGNRRMDVQKFRAAWKEGIAFVVTRERP